MAKGSNNYINRLEDENAELKAQLQAAQDQITEMMLYLQGSKFHGPDNDYVYVSTDILPKLSSLRAITIQ